MFPKTHFILGVVFSFLLFLIFPQINIIEALVILFSSFLVDIDHYFYYLKNKKDLSLKRAYNWFIERGRFWNNLKPKEREKFEFTILLFHGLEICIILLLLAFVHNIFLYVLVGISFHLILDFIELSSRKMPIYTKLSVLYTHIINKKNKSLS